MPGGVADTFYAALKALRSADLVHSTTEHGILRRGDARKAGNGGGAQRGVQWRAVLVAGDDDGWEVNAERSLLDKQAELDKQAAFHRYLKLVRLVTLAYEELALPLRVGFPIDFASLLAPIIADTLAEAFELWFIVHAVRREFRAHKLALAPQIDAAARRPLVRPDERDAAPYTLARLVSDLAAVFALVIGRALLLRGGFLWPWLVAQLIRLVRLRDLVEYMTALNADLTTNVTVFAVFKFALVVFSVPHWVSCVWWVISRWTADNSGLQIPSWTAQYEMLAGVPGLFEPTETSAVRSYMMAQYMAWSGVASMGYASITLVKQSEIWFGSLIILVQIVFYAYVLGTLFHYLVRTDEKTVRFKELLKAVEEYATRRRLPPSVSRKMAAHFEFQHRKQSSGTEAIFLQLPLSLRLRVASARYHAQIEHAWVFLGCNAQFLSQLVMVLKERYAMPLEMLFDRGDGSRELLWCTSGTLHVRKGDAHIATLRSDLGVAPIVGEVAFILGIVQPYTVTATGASEVTLLVLSVSDFDEIITSYPEQADVLLQNLLRRFTLSRDGTDLGRGLEPDATMSEDERAEFEGLRELVRLALLDRNDEALTQMTYAASEGDVDRVRALAARGLNLNAGDYDNRTTLHLACSEGNARVVALLCQLGANPNVRDRWGSAPIESAVDNKHEAVLDVLHHAGIVLDVADPARLLCDAASRGDLDRLNRLLENGIAANLGDFDGRTPLHLAAAAGNMRVVEFLVAKLADVSTESRDGATAADDAVAAERALVTQLLVRSGARPNPLTMLKSLCEAAAAGDVNLVRFLVETGVSLDAGDYDGRTALHLACAAGSISTTHFLIGAMADVEARDRWGKPPLIDALWTSNECAALLVQQCNAKLPPQHAHNDELLALFEAAAARDMYATNRKLNARAARRKQLQLLKRHRSRELGLALKALLDAVSSMYRAARPLYALLLKHAERWIETYGQTGNGSDADSQASCSDDDWSDYDSDDEVPDGARGSRSHSRGESVDADGGAMAAVGERAHAHGEGPAAVDPAAAAKNFIRLVLRLPQAEKALGALSLAFRARLSPDTFAPLDRAERLEREHVAMIGLLVEAFELDAQLAESVCDEIYAELAQLLGPSAPRRPRARRGRTRQFGGSVRACVSAGGTGTGPGTGGLWCKGGALSPLDQQAPAHSLRPSGASERDDEGEPDGLDEGSCTFLSQVGYVAAFCSEALIALLVRAGDTDGGVDAEPPAAPPGRASAKRKSDRELAADVPAAEALTPANRPLRRSLIDRWLGNAPPPPRAHDSASRADGGPLAAPRGRHADTQLEALSGSQPPDGGGGWAKQARRFSAISALSALSTRLGRRSAASSADGSHGSVNAAWGPSTPSGRRRNANGQAGSRGRAAAGPTRVDLRAEVAPAAALLEGLFAVFDSTGRGVIRVRDLRSLQGSLGEMGGQEIKSLLAHLFDASSSGLGGVDGGKPGGPKGARQLSKVQFYAGASSWIFSREGDEDAESGGLVAHGAARAGAGGNKVVPTLRLGARGAAPERANDGPDGDGATDAAPTYTLAVDRTLRVQLASAHYLAALADAIQMRIDLGRLRRDEAVDSDALVSLILNAVAIDPKLVRRSDVEAWALDELHLDVSARGIERDAPEQRNSLRAVLGAAAGALEDFAASRVSTASSTARVERASGAGASTRRSSAGASASRPLVAAAASDAGAPRVRARWRELVSALRARSAQLRLAEKAAGAVGAAAGVRTPLVTDWVGALRARLGLKPPAASSDAALLTAAATAAAAAGLADAEVAGDGRDADGGSVRAAAAAQAASAVSAGGKPWYIISHVGATNAALTRVFLCLFTWELLVQPATLCFWANTRSLTWLFYLSHALDALYIVRIALRLHTSFVNAKSVIIYDPVEIRAHYLATEFTYDALFTLPLSAFSLALSARPQTAYALRLPRLGLARYVGRAYIAWEKRQADNDLATGIMRFLSIIIVVGHFAACVWNLLGFEFDGIATLELHDGPPVDPTYMRTWPAQYNGLFHEGGATTENDLLSADVSEAWTLVQRYSIALYLSLSMLSGLGINHLPTNYVEIATYLLMLICSMTVYAWAVGGISALVMKQDDEIVSKRGQLELVHAYLTHIDVPAELKAHVEGFFHARLRDASFSSVRDEDIAGMMPIALQIEVSRHTNRQLIGEAKLLRGCSDAFIDRLSSLLRERALEPETQLFREGEVCKELFFVESGSVELWQGANPPGTVSGDEDDDNELQLALASDTVGDLAFVFGIRHFNSGRTASDVETRVFVLSADSYRILLKTFPLQEDKVMDNAMLQYDGMLTGRSGKSKASSTKSSALGSVMSESQTASRCATSTAGSAAGTLLTAAQTDEEAIQKVITTAKKRREDMHVVRLCEAAAKGDLEKIQRILSSNRIDVNRGDYDKRRPLHLAACEGQIKVIELLIVAQADVNVKDRFDGTPLADALRHRKLAAAELLHRHGAFRDTTNLSEQLCYCAADPKRVEELDFHMRFQTDFSASNYELRTALHVAASNGNTAAARMLIDAKADVNAVDRRGRTPLYDAFSQRHADTSELLLARGALMGTFDAALHMCYAAATDDLNTLSRLIKHRCSVNTADYDKRTPLHLAASNARVAACTLLLEQPGINMAAEDLFGNTALDDAEREDTPDQPIVRALLRARGVPIGSHEMTMAVTLTHTEEIKADVEAKQTDVQRDVTDETGAFCEWVREQGAASSRMHRMVEGALRLEVDQGEVLTDAYPKFWHELQSYADAHPARLRMVHGDLKEALASWASRAVENRFDISMVGDLERRLAHLMELTTGVAKHLERLAQTDFTPRGSQAVAERNAATNARAPERFFSRRGSGAQAEPHLRRPSVNGARGGGDGGAGGKHDRDRAAC